MGRKGRMIVLVLLLVFGQLLGGCGQRETEEPEMTGTVGGSGTLTETGETPVPIEPPPGSGTYEFCANGISVRLDLKTGLLTGIRTVGGELNFAGLLVDVGIGGSYACGSLTYAGYDALSSTALPTVSPKQDFTLSQKEADFRLAGTSDSLFITRTVGQTVVCYRYRLRDDAVALTVSVSSLSEMPQLVNGVAFSVIGMELPEDACYEYPGNMPYGSYAVTCRRKYIPNSTLFCNAVTHFYAGSGDWNLYFIDGTEKWSTAVWQDADGKATLCNLAAVEGKVSSSHAEEVGTLYLQVPQGDPYRSIQDFYATLGYRVPEAASGVGAIYCCHPYGTSDTGYSLQKTFAEYAAELETIRDNGFDTVWLLPINAHTGENDLYSPSDLSLIDARYGGAEEVRAFIEKAHALGMKVIFDVVPHGPRENEASDDLKKWASVGRTGRYVYEWDCLSCDYADPEYRAYITEIMRYYAEELGADGVRIDCAMGGRTNWGRQDGIRPSASNLYGAVEMTGAIRQGFTDAGVDPVILPEMFYPIPNYTKYTGLYYNNALYRVLWDLNTHYQDDRVTYTQKLTEFLDIQHRTKVRGQIMVNWLGNHDTVCWSGEAKRADQVYGSDWVRNMFRLIAWIDGIPVIYQGDENPAAYGLEGEEREAFFAELLSFRQTYLPVSLETEYVYSDQPVFAFYRYGENGTRYLILLNFSDSTQNFSARAGQVLFADGADLNGDTATLGAYGALVIDCSASEGGI